MFSGALKLTSAFVFAVLLSIASQSVAMPVLCAPPYCQIWSSGEGGNGHGYSFVHLTSDVTWTMANALAQGSIAMADGSVGHLATIGSAEEQSFIQNSVLPVLSYFGTNPTQVWIGGRQDPDQPPSDGWTWVVNPSVAPETWNYENWMTPGEPDDQGGIDERYLTMWFHNFQDGIDRRGSWNDERDLAGARIIGMLVEWSPRNLPEPGAACLVAFGIGLLALRRCRRHFDSVRFFASM